MGSAKLFILDEPSLGLPSVIGTVFEHHPNATEGGMAMMILWSRPGGRCPWRTGLRCRQGGLSPKAPATSFARTKPSAPRSEASA